MRRSFLVGLLLLCARPALADEPGLSVSPEPAAIPASLAGLLGSLTWAPGSGPTSAETPAAPSPQTPPAQAPVKSQPVAVVTPRAAVQAPPAAVVEHHHYFHYMATAAAPVMQAPVVQATPQIAAVQPVAMQAVVQQPVYRRAGPLRRGFGLVAGELAKIGWDRQLVPPAPKSLPIPTPPPQLIYVHGPGPVGPIVNAEAPAPPMAPVKATPQQ